MIRENGNKGFGEIFKDYGDALDIMRNKQKELSVWKGDANKVIQPFSKIDLENFITSVSTVTNEVKKLSGKFDILSMENESLKKEYVGVRNDYCLIKEENEQLKKELLHVQELTDIISFTCSKECADFKNRAKRKVLLMLGGNVTDNRYKLFYKKYIMNLYGYIKKEIGVSSIDKIPTAKLEEAKNLLNKWQPKPSFKTKLIKDLKEDTSPDKNGNFRVKNEVVTQFNALMNTYDDPVKYM